MQESLIKKSFKLHTDYKVISQACLCSLPPLDFLINDQIVISINGPSHYYYDKDELNSKSINLHLTLLRLGLINININIYVIGSSLKLERNNSKYLSMLICSQINSELSNIKNPRYQGLANYLEVKKELNYTVKSIYN